MAKQTLPEKPNQPRGLNFPKREFGKSAVVRRSFQDKWFDRWSWLHYLEASDSVLCFTCLRAHSEKKLQWSSNADESFIVRGFTNWKDATVKFDAHQVSKCHKEAVLKVITLPATTSDVAESLSTQHQQEKLERRQCLLKILSSIRFLARQGLPLRGHGDDSSSNFVQLMKLRAEDDRRIEMWMRKKTDKYTSSDIQNEIMKVMAFCILRDVSSAIRSSKFCTIMVDETTDISNKEQVVLCLRWVDAGLEAHEDFIGLYEVESTHSAVLLQVIHDVLLRLDISINSLRGQCYDGAASMAGCRGGVATQLLKEEPRALYTHCYGHSLNLACSDAIKKTALMRNALDVVLEITKLIKNSPRRDALLQKLKEELSVESPGIRVLCPTRWTVRAGALHSILANYDVLQCLWTESLDIVKDAEMRGRILGVATYMKSFDFFLGVMLGEMLLRHSDNLSKSLQAPHMSAAEGQTVASMTVTTLQKVRVEHMFSLFWSKVTKMAGDLGIQEPVVPRHRKRPIRYEVGEGTGHVIEDAETRYRLIYYEALDLLINGIKDRFQQPGYQLYSKLEGLLLKYANKQDAIEELADICKFYGDDLDADVLKMQLGILASNIPVEPSGHDLRSVVAYLRDLSEAQRSLLSEVCVLASLILVMPATNAVSERSFSALRRIKTYLRSTMTQTRLNSILMVHTHPDIADKLNLIDVGNDFVRGSEHRQFLFGTFLSTDYSVQ